MHIAVSKGIRKVALIVSALMVLFICFSVAFILIEADHDCCGEECGVCMHIALLRSAMSGIKLLIAVAAAFFAALSLANARGFNAPHPLLRPSTLVSAKIKMNN